MNAFLSSQRLHSNEPSLLHSPKSAQILKDIILLMNDEYYLVIFITWHDMFPISQQLDELSPQWLIYPTTSLLAVQ